jgi:hypothetical protein
MVLLAPILPEPYASQWKQSLFHLSRTLIDQFYSAQENLFFTHATTERDKDIRVTSVDFGHTIKSFWMIRWTGLLYGDEELVRFAEENGARVLERAWLADSGSWASRVTPSGLDLSKEWWIYAELDQFAATMALKDQELSRYLERSYDYWFRFLVDPGVGEVWNTVDGTTHRPTGSNAKQHPWKNAYHSLEHALVGYITSAQLHGQPVDLYFAFKQAPVEDEIRPYFYRGTVAKTETTYADGHDVTRVTFRDLQ